jgi:hypothetical protein
MTEDPHPPNCADADVPCIDSKLLALHTSTVCLARALVMSGALDRQLYHSELDMGRRWLAQFDHAGHNLASFDALLTMLKDI